MTAAKDVVRFIDYEDEKACFGSFELFERFAPPEWCIEAAEFCDLSYIDRAALREMMEQECVRSVSLSTCMYLTYPHLSTNEPHGGSE